MKQSHLNLISLSLLGILALGFTACAKPDQAALNDHSSNARNFYKTTGLQPETSTKFPTGEYVPSGSTPTQPAGNKHSAK